MNYQEACDYIENIGKFSIKNSNEHTRRCLHLLGDPDRNIGPVIHVAGTNGKGSVCAYLTQMLSEAGLKTATFISPHLIRLNERISVDGEPIADEAFLAAFEKVRAVSEEMEGNGGGHPSYFEFLFLMAMVHFASAQTDAAVIETGLGGRLDATNSVEHPALSVITSISRDHMQYLGDTISAIAAEKAGIIKPGVPCIYDASSKEASEVIRKRAAELGSPAIALQKEDYAIRSAEEGMIDFSTSFRYDGRAHFQIATAAPYQVQNASLALIALQTLAERGTFGEKTPSGGQAAAGLRKMRWPARMEEIRPRVYLDGAHNEDGIHRFVEAARAIAGAHPAHLVFSVVNDKDFRDMIRELVQEMRWEDVIVTEIEGSRRTESGSLAELFREAGQRVVTAVPGFREAYESAISSQKEGDYVFICGSLYLAGEIEEIMHDKL